MSIVPGNSSGLSPNESCDSARTRSGHSETRGHFQERHRSPTQSISKNAGRHGRSIASATAGPASHAAPPTLVETTDSTQRMASRTPTHQGEPGLCDSPGPLEEPTMDGEGRGHGNGLQQESCHDRRLQHRLGGAVRRQTYLPPLVESGEGLPHQLLGNASSMSSLPVFPARPNRTPCADSLRQHVRGVLYKPSGRCLLEAPLHSGRPFRSKDSSHCPTYYSKVRDALAHDWPNPLLYAFPPIALIPQVIRRIREQGHKVLLVAPLWENQPWLSELTQLLTAAPWPVPLRWDLLSQANGTIWHPRPELWALLSASQSEC